MNCNDSNTVLYTYSPYCNVFIILLIQSLKSPVLFLPIISKTYASQSLDIELIDIFSVCLHLSLFSFNFPHVTFFTLPLFIIYPKNVNCHYLLRWTKSISDVVSIKMASSLRFKYSSTLQHSSFKPHLCWVVIKLLLMIELHLAVAL